MEKKLSLILIFGNCVLLAYITVWKATDDTLQHEMVIQPKAANDTVKQKIKMQPKVVNNKSKLKGTSENELKYDQAIRPKEAVNNVKKLNAFSKFSRYLPPEKDVNCLSTIPQRLLETSKESPIIIPRKEVLQDLGGAVLHCLYHRYLQTLQRFCTQPDRIGNLDTGGWYLCVDPEAKPRSPCLVYSFSDERNYGSFAQEMATRFKCSVFLYNPRKQNKKFADRVKTSNLKLDAENGISVHKLNTELKEKSQNTVNVLTLDINNREWDVLPQLLNSGILGKTEQLLIRFHSSQNDTSMDHYIKRLVVLRDLYDKGFRIFWSDKIRSCLHKTKKATGCYYINMIRIMNRPSPLVIPHEPEFSRMQPQQYGELFARYITSVQIPCKEPVRIGNIIDGGWEVCHDALFRPRKSCIVYSFGINNDFSFDDDVANTYGCKVYSFDPSMKQKDYRRSENVMFYATGIAKKNGKKGSWKMRNFITILEEHGQKEETIDILKMDVEGSEWESIPQMISSGVLKRVKQLAFELHVGQYEDDAYRFRYSLTFLRALYDEGFRIYWVHKNLIHRYTTKKGKQRASYFEIYMLNIS